MDIPKRIFERPEKEPGYLYKKNAETLLEYSIGASKNGMLLLSNCCPYNAAKKYIESIRSANVLKHAELINFSKKENDQFQKELYDNMVESTKGLYMSCYIDKKENKGLFKTFDDLDKLNIYLRRWLNNPETNKYLIEFNSWLNKRENKIYKKTKEFKRFNLEKRLRKALRFERYEDAAKIKKKIEKIN